MFEVSTGVGDEETF